MTGEPQKEYIITERGLKLVKASLKNFHYDLVLEKLDEEIRPYKSSGTTLFVCPCAVVCTERCHHKILHEKTQSCGTRSILCVDEFSGCVPFKDKSGDKVLDDDRCLLSLKIAQYYSIMTEFEKDVLYSCLRGLINEIELRQQEREQEMTTTQRGDR